MLHIPKGDFLMNIISGLFNESDIRVGIIASRFNEVIVDRKSVV